jgi:signal transduction histidine kinase
MTRQPVPSIYRQTLIWTTAALVVGATLLVGGLYLLLADEIDELFEDNLRQVALAVANDHGNDSAARNLRLAGQLPPIYDTEGKFEFVTAVWNRQGTLLYRSDPAVKLPFLSRSGLSDISIDQSPWHMYTIVLDDNIVQAAQRASDREALVRESGLKLILPALLMLTLLAALVMLALKRGLAPLSHAASDVTARNVEALHPIDLSGHPPEMHVLINAINDLMSRLGGALAQQNQFLADAAHELRTPVTALRLQLQLLERAADAKQSESALLQLRAGIERSQHLIQQLLALSRLTPETPALQKEVLDLAELVRRTVGHFSARAEDQHIDLGAVIDQNAMVSADAQQVLIMLNNLIDNALRYTPPGGRIDVGVGIEGSCARLSVTDNGPGIEPAERQRVFDRFYRAHSPSQRDATPGSGLGLAIVQAVVQRHGATIRLDEPPGGGLRVSVLFPPP